MISKKVVFQDSLGTNLVGILSRPVDSYDMPIVIACHGFCSNKDRMTYTTLEEKLHTVGIATFRFDFWGHGESGGDFANLTYSKGIENTTKAYKYIKNLGFQKIALFGKSFGGNVVMNGSIILGSTIACVASLCPVSDYQKQINRILGKDTVNEYKNIGSRIHTRSNGEKLTINYEIYKDAQINNIHIKGKDITIPTLIVHGAQDEVVKAEQSIQAQKVISDCTLKIIEGVGHNFKGENGMNKNPEAFKYTIDFFTTHLLPNG